MVMEPTKPPVSIPVTVRIEGEHGLSMAIGLMQLCETVEQLFDVVETLGRRCDDVSVVHATERMRLELLDVETRVRQALEAVKVEPVNGEIVGRTREGWLLARLRAYRRRPGRLRSWLDARRADLAGRR